MGSWSPREVSGEVGNQNSYTEMAENEGIP